MRHRQASRSRSPHAGLPSCFATCICLSATIAFCNNCSVDLDAVHSQSSCADAGAEEAFAMPQDDVEMIDASIVPAPPRAVRITCPKKAVDENTRAVHPAPSNSSRTPLGTFEPDHALDQPKLRLLQAIPRYTMCKMKQSRARLVLPAKVAGLVRNLLDQ